MQKERIIRIIAFVVFFSVGAAVLTGTLLCDDLLEHYYYKDMLAQTEEHNQKLANLDADYNSLLTQFENNPKELARLAPATLGIEANEPNTVYPRAAADKLHAARRALIEEPNVSAMQQGAPKWLCLSCQWPRRHAFFICGAILVLISFVFFGPVKKPPHTMEVKSSKGSEDPRP